MTTKHIARWIREEHAKVNELASRLRDHLVTLPSASRAPWIAELRERFEHLRAHLIKHMALEEQDGYMVPVMETRPTLSDQVDRLKHEHTELTRLLDLIHQTIGDLKPDDRLCLRDCCRRIDDFLSYLERHEQNENILVISVFTDDIGTEG
ncbi:MAG: hemerythrin domain-containing protein [Phycisphaerae bacterium]